MFDLSQTSVQLLENSEMPKSIPSIDDIDTNYSMQKLLVHTVLIISIPIINIDIKYQWYRYQLLMISISSIDDIDIKYRWSY